MRFEPHTDEEFVVCEEQLDPNLVADVEYDLRHWTPLPDRLVEAVAEANGLSAKTGALIRLVVFVIALVAEKRRRRKSVRELAAHMNGCSRRRAHEAQRHARLLWAMWLRRAQSRTEQVETKPKQDKPAHPEPKNWTGRIRDTSGDSSSRNHRNFLPDDGTDPGRSRERVSTPTPTTSSRIQPLKNTRRICTNRDPSILEEDCSVVVGQGGPPPQEIGDFPLHLSGALRQAGITTLKELSAFSRDGLAEALPSLARHSVLEALEGLLRKSGLSWKPARTQTVESKGVIIEEAWKSALLEQRGVRPLRSPSRQARDRLQVLQGEALAQGFGPDEIKSAWTFALKGFLQRHSKGGWPQDVKTPTLGHALSQIDPVELDELLLWRSMIPLMGGCERSAWQAVVDNRQQGLSHG